MTTLKLPVLLVCVLVIHHTVAAPALHDMVAAPALQISKKFHAPTDGSCDYTSLLRCLVSSTTTLYDDCVTKCENDYDTRHKCQKVCYETGYTKLEACIINFSIRAKYEF